MQSNARGIALAIVSIYIKSVTVLTFGNLLICLTNMLHVTILTCNQINDIQRHAFFFLFCFVIRYSNSILVFSLNTVCASVIKNWAPISRLESYICKT